MSDLMNADEFRTYLRSLYPDLTHERIGAELGLSAGFVGMLLDGTRRPSRAILERLGMERVVLYRLIARH